MDVKLSSAKITDFARLSFGMKFFLRKLTVSANAVVVGGFVQWSSSYKGNAAFQKEAEGRFSGIGNMS